MNFNQENQLIQECEKQRNEILNQISSMKKEFDSAKINEINDQIKNMFDEIKRHEVAEIRSYRVPPQLMKENIYGLLILLKLDLSWDSFLRISCQPGFFDQLKSLNIFKFEESLVLCLQDYMNEHKEAFEVTTVERVSRFNRQVAKYLQLTMRKYSEFKHWQTPLSEMEGLEKKIQDLDAQISSIHQQRKSRIVSDYKKLIQAYKLKELNLSQYEEYEIKERLIYLREQMELLKKELEQDKEEMSRLRAEQEAKIEEMQRALKEEFSRNDQAVLSHMSSGKPHQQFSRLMEQVLILLGVNEDWQGASRNMLKDQEMKDVLLQFNPRLEINISKYEEVWTRYKRELLGYGNVSKAVSGLRNWVGNAIECLGLSTCLKQKDDALEKREAEWRVHVDVERVLEEGV